MFAKPSVAALVLLFFLSLHPSTPAAEAVQSSGIFLAPARDVPNKVYTGDLAPSQVLEIIRPDSFPVVVSRLSTSCTCITAGTEKKSFAAGERALVEVRNVKATPSAGATYMVFVELASPTREMLTYDLFVRSGFPDDKPAPLPEPPVATEPAASPANPAPKPPAFKYEDVTPYPAREKEAAAKE